MFTIGLSMLILGVFWFGPILWVLGLLILVIEFRKLLNEP